MIEDCIRKGRSGGRRLFLRLSGFGLLAIAVAGCSSEAKYGAMPPEAIPAESGAPLAATSPATPSADRTQINAWSDAAAGGTAPPKAIASTTAAGTSGVNPFSDAAAPVDRALSTSTARSTPSFSRPTSSVPYAYASSMGSGVRYGTGGAYYGTRGPTSGSSSTYYGARATSGSGSAYYGARATFGSAAPSYGSRAMSGSYGSTYRPPSGSVVRYGGSGMAGPGSIGGGAPVSNPADARLSELERRTAELEQRIQALVPAVQRAVQGAK